MPHKKKTFQKFLKDERGQADLIGNIFEIIKTQPWILTILFLAIIFTTTLSVPINCNAQKNNLGCVNLQIYPVINTIINGLFGAFGVNIHFDYRQFVILCFLGVIAFAIVKYGISMNKLI